MLKMAFLIFVFVTANLQAAGVIYYSQSSGYVNTLSNWNTSITGGGSTPANFTSGDIFIIKHSMSANAQWVVSGTGAKVVIAAYASFSSSGYDHDLTLDIENSGSYTHTVGTSNNLKNGTFGATSNFTIKDPTGFKSDRPYGNLTLDYPSGTASATTDMTVNGSLTLTNNSRLTASNNLTVYGDITTYSGTTILYGANNTVTSVYGHYSISGQISYPAASGIRYIELYGTSKSFRLSSSNSGGAYGNYHVRSGASYSNNSGFTLIGTAPEFVVDGIFEISGSNYISGNYTSTFKVNSGGTLRIAHPSGILATGADGAVRTTNRIFDTGANYNYASNTAQYTGDALPTTLSGNLTFANNYGTTLTNSITTSGNVTVSGVLKMGGKTISGIGTFTLNSGASLYIDSPDGISSSGATGNIQTNTRNFHASAHYYYTGSAAQVTGTGLPALLYGSLYIQNSSGVTLSQNSELRILSLTGRLHMGEYNLTLSPNSSVSGEASINNMVVQNGTGRLTLRFSEAEQPQVAIGDYADGTYRYSLFSLYVRASAFSNARITLEITRGKHEANTSSSNYLTRSWKFTGTGLTSPLINLYVQYDNSDITGDESLIFGARYDGTNWNIMGAVYPSDNSFQQSDMTGFYTVTGGEESALPVELVSFKARRSGKTVILDLQTATEVDNSGFSIEKSSGKTWEAIGFVEGSGTSNSPKYYTFTDPSPGSTRTLYRLKQLDNDGSYSYSAEVSVDALPQVFTLHQNYPNPFNPVTVIRYALPVDGDVELSVYNALGKKVAEIIKGFRQAGEHEVNFNANGLPSGVYFYELRAGQLKLTKKMIVLE